MGMKINSNLFSLITNKNLDSVSQRLERSYERLASGRRIARAGDDPAGLAISQGLRHEVRAMHQNIRNANDGLSVTASAEAALNETTGVLQRMRELAIQAGGSTLSATNRQAIQAEIDQMVAEIERIAQTTEFNGRVLLNGTDSQTKVQIGVEGAQFISVTLPDARTTFLGARAQVSETTTMSATPITGSGDLTINGVTVPTSTDDGVSVTAADSSAPAKARAINSIAERTNVDARIEPTVYTVAGSSVSTIALDGATNSLTINGVNIGAVSVTADDADGTLIDMINASRNITGVVTSMSPAGELVLTAEDGRNIEITTTGSVADELGLALSDGDLTNYLQTGRITLVSPDTITVGGDFSLIGLTAGQATTDPDSSLALDSISVMSENLAQEAILTLDYALKDVLTARANLGAIQNRLESSVQSLGLQIEEIEKSNSRILDTDFAQETATQAQLEILQQAGIAILTQANNLPRTALRMLMQ